MAAFVVASTVGESVDDAFVIGGTDITEVVPWFVFFGNCGGVLIHTDIVLTNAQCVDGVPSAGFPENVRIGILDRDENGANPGDTMKVLGGVIHPGWDTTTETGVDFAVIKLDQKSSREVAPLNSVAAVPAVDAPLFTMGLGDSNNFGLETQVVQGGFVKAATCAITTNNPVCALPNPATICVGDGGSPLVTRDVASDGTVVYGPIIGLGSRIDGSCGSVNEMQFARVSESLAWIQEQVCSLSIDPPASCGTNADVTPYKYTLVTTYFFPEGVLKYRVPTASDNVGLEQITEVFYRRVIAAVNAMSYKDVDITIALAGFKVDDITVIATWDLEVTFNELSKYPSRAELQTTIDSVKKDLYVRQFINNAPPGGNLYQQ